MARIFKVAALLFFLTHAAGCFLTAGDREARLRLAACEGRVTLVKALAKTPVNINARSNDGSTALIAAEACGQKEEAAGEIVKVLIDRGADVNLEDKRGMTPLMYAALHGHSQVIRQLLAQGAACDVKDNEGQTALMYAATNGCSVEALRALIEAGADLNARNKRGQSVLDAAKASKACPSGGMSQTLIDNGAH